MCAVPVSGSAQVTSTEIRMSCSSTMLPSGERHGRKQAAAMFRTAGELLSISAGIPRTLNNP